MNVVSRFECACPLFRRRTYNVVSPSADAIRIGTCDQYIRLLLLILIGKSEEKSKTEMKTKSNSASDGSLTLPNSFLKWN